MQPSKQELIQAYSKWIESSRSEWVPFAVTCVFKASGQSQNPTRWLNEYKSKVVWKINKRLSRRKSELITFHEICYYEFDLSGLRRSVADGRSPHHVHGIVGVPATIVCRVWDQANNKLDDRLAKDFKSIDTVQSVLMEPVIEGHTTDWLVYISKGKDFNQ